MPKVIIFFTALLLTSTGGARSLQDASRQELQELRKTIEERLKYFEFLTVLDKGIPADAPSTAKASQQNYLQRSNETESLLQVLRTTPLCNKFVDTYLSVAAEIKDGLSQFYKSANKKKEKLLLEGRLSVLSQMRLQLISLIETDQEGGVQSLTGQADICSRSNREQLKENLLSETTQLNEVYKKLFGVRGLIEANRLSVALAHLAESQAASQLRWFLPKTIGMTTLAIVGWELIVVKGLAALATAGTLSPAAAKAVLTGLKVASGATTATIGGIQGSRLAAASIPILAANEEEYLLEDINKFIKSSLNSPEILFDRIFPTEGRLANELLQMKRESKANAAYILEKWGSIEGAQSYHQKKLAEINDLLAR